MEAMSLSAPNAQAGKHDKQGLRTTHGEPHWLPSIRWCRRLNQEAASVLERRPNEGPRGEISGPAEIQGSSQSSQCPWSPGKTRWVGSYVLGGAAHPKRTSTAFLSSEIRFLPLEALTTPLAIGMCASMCQHHP